MKRMSVIAGVIGLFLVGLGFWSLQSIGKIEPFEFEDDADCCNGDFGDCIC